MPEGSRSNETSPTGSPELNKLAEKIGEVAGHFTEEQAAALNNPSMHAKLEQWQDAGHLNNSAFISGLVDIAREKVDKDAGTNVPVRERAVTTADKKDKDPLIQRLKLVGRRGLAAAIGAGAIASGAGVAVAVEQMSKDSSMSAEYAYASVDGRMIEQNATEAEMTEFFSLTPSTHEQTKETPDTKDDFNFRPTREALFSYDGSEASVQMIIDDMSDMFRRDVRIQAAWASTLKVEGAPRLPSSTELQDPQVYYDYHQELYKYTDKLARDIKERTKAYNEMMGTLKGAKWSEKIHEATTDQISVGHDGNRVTIAQRVGDRGRDAQYVPFQAKNAAGEEVVEAFKLDCGQWCRMVQKAAIPEAKILDQPRPVFVPPAVTEIPRTNPPVTTVYETPPPPTQTETPPPPPPPPTTEWTPAPKNPVDISPPPAPVQGQAPEAIYAPPPPPPPPRYTPPAFQMPDFGNIFQAPGSRPSTGVWERGQGGSGGSSPSIPRNNNTSPSGGSGFNGGMTSE